MQTYYRKPLPDGQIAFSSTEGRQLFKEALEQGNAESFFALSEQFHTQAEPGYCALGTLVVVLNALGIDPGRLWKGPWRWFSEELLDCCYPLDAVKKEGLTFEQFECLAQCNGATVEAKRAQASLLKDFRKSLIEACRSGHSPFLVVSYSRKALGQTGEGHYSPIAAYHQGRDMALVLDVARFKYPPHWVSVAALFEAMKPIDPSTQQSRGYFLMSRGDACCTLCFRIYGRDFDWRIILEHLTKETPNNIAQKNPSTAEEALSSFLTSLSPALLSMLALEEPQEPEHQEQQRALRVMLDALPLSLLVQKYLPVPQSQLQWKPGPALVVMLLLIAGEHIFSQVKSELHESLRAYYHPSLSSPLREEVERLREQLSLLMSLRQ
jgi:glutathione gamma-glutamylcysteinyltransferase